MIRLLTWLTLLSITSFSYAQSNTEQYPQRIVALAPHIVESLFEIGAGDRIVATVDYADYPAAALDIPRVGGYYGLQMEKILALQPDLVIVWQNGNRQQDIDKLKQLGLPLAYSKSGKVADVAQELLQFGDLTGNRSQAQQAAEAFKAKYSAIKSKYKPAKDIQVFYQLWSEPMMTVNKKTWIHELITICGASNVFADAETEYPQISLENVVVAKPELIIIPDEKSEKPQPKVNWQPWQVIPAVKNDAFIHINADLIHRFSSRMLLGVEDMCQKVDKFRD